MNGFCNFRSLKQISFSRPFKIKCSYKEQSLSSKNSTLSTPITKRNQQYFTLLRQNAVPTNENKILSSEPEMNTESELNNYLEQPIDNNFYSLLWWQAHYLNEFPV
ncbi:hypothetical protein RclHR1_03680011 [Rhizophagus clarus]|uniref:Uncharacterized protein n=1 Tax=Rhizophagus clarus TaxID=94130 RepID=A0A2Z6S6N8_9GLOM|nr:hypothetical protein RclHR1_03680011 [Rhizophagus clarus]GES76415.1 hypothetical protein RCL_jg26293.t1 [Rhizophagus clarus]